MSLRAARRPWLSMLLVPTGLILAVWLLPFGPGRQPAWTAATDPADDATRQVTVFGIQARPGRPHVDPALIEVSSQLRKLLPEHGFRLLGAENQRLARGNLLSCDLENDLRLDVTLLEHLNDDGKVRLQLALVRPTDDATLFKTEVVTPPNQLLFLEKKLEGSENDVRLLIGLGAR